MQAASVFVNIHYKIFFGKYIYIYIFLDHLLMQMSKGKYFTVFAGGIRDASGSAGLEDDVIRTPIFVSPSLTLKNILRMVSCSR